MKPTSFLLRVASLVVIAFALWSVAAASRPRASYYPLGRGLAWEYEIKDSGGQTGRLRVINGGERQVGRWRATEQRMEMGSTVGYRFAVEQPNQIVTVAEQRPGVTQPEILEPPSTMLRLPATPGDSWESGSTTAVMAPGAVVQTKATIESVDDDILVPAGAFNSCVRVSSAGQLSVRPQDVEGPVELVVRTLLWYAPGVGLVQMTRQETTDRPELGKLELTYKLTGR